MIMKLKISINKNVKQLNMFNLWQGIRQGLVSFGSCRHRVASGGRSVAPRWPRVVARLRRSAGGIPLSFRTWSIHRSRGWPGRRFHWSLGGRPRDRSTWQWRALCVGTSCGSLATWPKRALRWRRMISDIDGKPVVAVTSSFLINCCQLICSSCL